MASDVIVLFALQREARPFLATRGGDADKRVAISGVGRDAAKRTLEHLLTDLPRPGLVIAAGFCGALASGLAAGDVVVPTDVIDESGRRWACRPVPGLHQAGRLVTTSRMIGDPAEKNDVRKRFDAVAVDMESAGVAEVCVERDLPFAAVRAVSDTADTALSPRLASLLTGGRVSPLRALGAILRQPSILGEFRRLARDTRLAARNLAAVLRDVVVSEPRRGGELSGVQAREVDVVNPEAP